MTIDRRPAAKGKTVVTAGVAAIALTGALAAPAPAAPRSGSAPEGASVENGDLLTGVRFDGPADPRVPGGPATRRVHHWFLQFQLRTVSLLNQLTHNSWQRDYRGWTVAIIGNTIQGKEVTIHTRITNLYFGEGGVIGGETSTGSQVAVAHNIIVAQGNVNIVTEINNVRFLNPRHSTVINGQCTAREDLRETVERLACLMG